MKIYLNVLFCILRANKMNSIIQIIISLSIISVIVTYRFGAKSIDENFQNFLHSLNQDQIPDFFKNSNDK